MCAVAYTVWFEEARRRYDVEVQAAILARSMGQDIAIPDLDVLRRRFDELLAEEPGKAYAVPTTRTDIIREAFGTNVPR